MNSTLGISLLNRAYYVSYVQTSTTRNFFVESCLCIICTNIKYMYKQICVDCFPTAVLLHGLKTLLAEQSLSFNRPLNVCFPMNFDSNGSFTSMYHMFLLRVMFIAEQS